MKDFVEIGGKEYRVEFNFNTFGDYCEAKGGGFELLDNFGNMGPNDFRLLVWCGVVEGERLEGRDCTLTAKDLGAQMDATDLSSVLEIINRHYASESSEEDKGKGGAVQKKRLRWFSRK